MVFIESKTIALPLKENDKFDVIAVSSNINDEESLKEGLSVLNSWGLICRNNRVIGRHWGYLAGKDSVRHKELHPKQPIPLQAFARGGWGAARILEFDQPWKAGWLLGFSDVSAILLSRLSAGFDGGIHGPLINSLSKEPEWSKERLRAILFGEPIADLYGDGWSGGIAQGPLVACNLTVASHLLGSRHIPELKGAILIFEDIDEEPYKIDRMLTQWRLTGNLQKLAGLAFGNFKDCQNSKEAKANSFELEEVLKDRSIDLNIPIVASLPVGHLTGNASLPLGRNALLDGDKGILKIYSS